MKIETDDIIIISGEGIGPGTIERYHGARTKKAIRNKLSREREHGTRWAWAWIQLDGSAYYGKLAPSLEEIVDQRLIFPEAIHDNPAAVLAHKGARK